MFTSWKTTTAGVVTILGAVFALKKTFLVAWASGDFTAIAPAVAALFTGIGLVCARDNGVTSEQAGAATAGISQKTAKDAKEGGFALLEVLAVVAILGVLISLVACAAVQPGADKLVVRCEQAEAGAAGTFDLVVKTDDADRGFWAAKAPGFHKFAEFLREPIGEGTNALPRGLALVRSVDVVKRDYQAGRASSNAVVATLMTLQGVVSEGVGQLGAVTNVTVGK
jgi:prepilin-type N-terminal cleavage/methylation domain-containing protein